MKKALRKVKRMIYGDTASWRVAVFLPLAVPAALAVFSVVTMIWLLTDLFYGWLVWPTGILAAAGVMWWLYKKYPHEHRYSLEEKICTIIVLVGVVFWVGGNALFTSQHIHTDRDPANYATAGFWLANHNSLRVTNDATLNDIDEVDKSKPGEAGVFAQRPHLFSALIGAVGKVAGMANSLHLNPLFGGTALLAVYGFGRLLMRHRWAVVATGATAVTLPLIYFSRDTYTEPLVMTFTFAAMAFLVLAWRHKQALFWVLAGLLAGAGQLARIDMMLSIIGLVFALFVGMAVVKRNERRDVLGGASLFFGALGLTLLISMADLLQLSPNYYSSHKMYIVLQFAVLAAVVVAGVVAVALVWHERIAQWLEQKTTRWRAMAAAAGVGIIGVVLASRPLWMQDVSNKNVNGLVVGLQEAASLPVNGHQTYAEHTVSWLAWYMGWPLVIVGLLGAMVIAYRVMKRREIVWIVALAVVLGTALAYCVKPAITPDQIWASRRLLPVVMPGVALFGAFFIGWFSLRKLPWRVSAKMLAMIGATVMIAMPLMISLPFATVRTYNSQYGQTKSICENTPDNAVVVWVAMARLNMVQSTKAMCNIHSTGFKEDTVLHDQDVLKRTSEAVRSAGRVPVVGVYGSQFGVVPEEYREAFVETSAISFFDYNHHLLKAPSDTRTELRSLLIAEIAEDGTLVAPSWLKK